MDAVDADQDPVDAEGVRSLRALLATVPERAADALTRLRRRLPAVLGEGCEVVVDAVPDAPEGRSLTAGRVGVVWTVECPRVPDAHRLLVAQACAWATLALERDDTADAARAADAERDVVTEVVEQLLSVRDVDQLLLSIATRTRELLDADICGVLLREGEEVRMRSCVGHRVVETSRLRMCRGQGVAGLVFETGRPSKVDRYVDDTTISRDFVGLAEREQTRSALAVPLAVPGEFLGVLEVWRRRASVFTDDDVRRMVTLASFATIALRSARSHDEMSRTNLQLQRTHHALRHQVTVLGRTAELQQSLLATVLQGGGLSAIARHVAVELRCAIGIYDATGFRLAVHGRSDLPKTLPPGPATRQTVPRPAGLPQAARFQPVHVDGDDFGWVCLVPADDEPTGEEMLDAVAGQVAMACSLTLLRERAASRARREALNDVLWDLVQGPPEHRSAARARALQLGVSLGAGLRVLHGYLENVEELALAGGWDTSRVERLRREVVRTLRDREDGPRLALVACRGDLVVAVVDALDAASARRLVDGIAAAVRQDEPDLRSSWGISRPHDDADALQTAFNEAGTALSASRRLGGQTVSLYEELGVVRLLLGSGSDPDLQTFIDDVTGPLVAYDRDNDGALVQTLRAFFESDCSQRVAAEKLFVHHKTLRYRLERVKQLTGLDLARHDDRLRADVALRLLQINGEGSD